APVANMAARVVNTVATTTAATNLAACGPYGLHTEKGAPFGAPFFMAAKAKPPAMGRQPWVF
ncbi:hypothetical protein, partial [Acetobacter pasteurianus]|uniref:hypothetical protein n=1 Tax=Acetobacter pasteurianus TaxID=438 RepID=UPI001A7E11D7